MRSQLLLLGRPYILSYSVSSSNFSSAFGVAESIKRLVTELSYAETFSGCFGRLFFGRFARFSIFGFVLFASVSVPLFRSALVGFCSVYVSI